MIIPEGRREVFVQRTCNSQCQVSSNLCTCETCSHERKDNRESCPVFEECGCPDIYWEPKIKVQEVLSYIASMGFSCYPVGYCREIKEEE